MLPGVAFALAWLMLTTFAAAQSIVWDDFNARVWNIRSEHPKDRQRVVREWLQDDDRFVLHIAYRPGEATSRYLLAFTNLLSPEPLSQVREIRFALKWDRRPANATVRLQAKQLLAPYAKADERLIVDEPVPLRSGGYQEYRVPIQTTAALSRLLLVFENVQGAPSEIYLDHLRFVRTEQEFVWESFDHRPRLWVPFGARRSGIGPTAPPLLDMTSTFDGFPGGPTGALLLHWDARSGRREGIPRRGAELKTEGDAFDAMERGHPPPGLNADFSAFSTMSADVISTNPNTLGVFFGHYIDGTTLMDRGFMTPGVRVMTPGHPQRLSWDIPWPPHFPADDVDVVAFVVRDTDIPELAEGTLRLDNVVVSPAAFPHPDEVHAAWYLSHFDFDARDNMADRSGVEPDITFLGGNMGTFSPHDALTPQKIRVRHDATQSAHIDPAPGASFRVDLDLSQVDFVGGFISLFGHSDFKDAYTLDLTQFSQLQLSLRPGDTHAAPMWLRIEIKDYRDSHDYTAYRYVHIPAAPVTWHRLVLNADITDPAHWRFNRFPPDPTRAKFLNLVVERFFNAPHLTFYLDELRLIHKTDKPFKLPEAKRQGKEDGLDALLAHVQHKAWLHFDRWVVDGVASDPDLYLFLDRSSFPAFISTAAAGFGLAALVVGHRSGWLSEAEATSRVLRVLRTYADGRMIDDPSTVEPSDLDASIGVKGWFWHFLERDGTRKRTTSSGDPLPPAHKSELSSVDTAIFLWGALAARDYFRSTNPEINPLGSSPRAAEIAELVARIYHRIDFPFFRRAEETPPKQGQIYLGWKPEWIDSSMSSGVFTVPVPGFPDGQAGYFSGMPEDPATWDRMTDETLMILLLGAASPNVQLRLPASVFPLQAYLLHPSPLQTYTATCEHEVVGPIWPSFFGSGFTYFFLQNFFKADRRLEPLLGLNLLQNAQRVARASWLYSRCGARTNAPTFDGNVFGLTAAEGRDGNYHGEWGAPPREANVATDDGTVAVYGPLGYLPLWPDDFSDPDRVAFRNPSMDALVTLFQEGRIFDDAMGFGDGISLVPEPDTGLRYYNMVTFGIDNGAMVMGIENERSGLFWRLNLLCHEMAAAGIWSATDGDCAGVAKHDKGR